MQENDFLDKSLTSIDDQNLKKIFTPYSMIFKYRLSLNVGIRFNCCKSLKIFYK